MARFALGLVAALALAAPVHAQEEPIDVTVVTSGPRAEELREALRDPDLPVTVRFAELPVRAPETDAPPPDLAAARQAYVNADFGACLSELEDEAPVHEALAAGQPGRAARRMFWRLACHVGMADPEGARRVAARFAAFGLDVPDDVEAASPEVEVVLGEALAAVAQAPRVAIAVRGAEGAAVSVDGRPASCEVPCAVDLAPGDHVLALRAPGFEASSRLVRVDGPAEVSFSLERASPERAGAQWAARWIGRPGRDSPASVRLLSQAVRARRLMLLLVDPGPQLRGVLARDGAVAARAERLEGPLPDAARSLFRELLVEGGEINVGEVYESPWFWLGIGGAAVAAAVITAIALFVPDTETCVSFAGECR